MAFDKQDKRHGARRAFFILTVLVAILCQILWGLSRPNYRLTYNQGSIDTSGKLPLYLTNGSPLLKVRVVMTLHAVRPSLFHVAVDDCLIDVQVNGKTVPLATFESCASDGVLALGRFLHAGENVIEAKVENRFGDSKFTIEPYILGDRVFLPAKAGILMLVITVGIFLKNVVMRCCASWVEAPGIPRKKKKSRS